MQEAISGFFGWLFGMLGNIFGGLLEFLTFNPLAGLPSPVNSGLLETVDFVDNYLPVRAMFQAVASALPWFTLLVVAGIGKYEPLHFHRSDLPYAPQPLREHRQDQCLIFYFRIQPILGLQTQD